MGRLSGHMVESYTGWSKKRIGLPNFIFGITSVIQHRF